MKDIFGNSFFDFKSKNCSQNFEFYFLLFFLKRMGSKIEVKCPQNMKRVANHLNFVFYIEVKTKSKYKILNFVFPLSETRNDTLGTRI